MKILFLLAIIFTACGNDNSNHTKLSSDAGTPEKNTDAQLPDIKSPKECTAPNGRYKFQYGLKSNGCNHVQVKDVFTEIVNIQNKQYMKCLGGTNTITSADPYTGEKVKFIFEGKGTEKGVITGTLNLEYPSCKIVYVFRADLITCEISNGAYNVTYKIAENSCKSEIPKLSTEITINNESKLKTCSTKKNPHVKIEIAEDVKFDKKICIIIGTIEAVTSMKESKITGTYIMEFFCDGVWGKTCEAKLEFTATPSEAE